VAAGNQAREQREARRLTTFRFFWVVLLCCFAVMIGPQAVTKLSTDLGIYSRLGQTIPVLCDVYPHPSDDYTTCENFFVGQVHVNLFVDALAVAASLAMSPLGTMGIPFLIRRFRRRRKISDDRGWGIGAVQRRPR